MKFSRIGWLLLFVGGTTNLAAPQLRADTVERDSLRFKSDGRPIDLEVFRSGARLRGAS